MKKLIALVIAAVMILSMIPVMAVSTSAAGEGMWTTYRSAGNYPAIDDEPDPDGEETIYPPESGYEYTADGFSIVQPNWSGVGPFVTVSTTEEVNLKDGLYLEFRVDDYSYGGEVGADHWICLTLNTGKVEDGATEGYEAGTKTGKVAPGSPAYGGGWLTLLRGIGDGNVTSLPHLTDPKTEDFGGTFVNVGSIGAPATLDDDGREINTLEVSWTGSEYEIKVNGVVQPGQAQTTAMLEKLAPNGDVFVGITMMDGLKGGSAGLTVTKFGTSASDATKPVGSDSKEPEENNLVEAPIADPSTVEPNKPAILWNPDTVNLKSGNNINFTVQGDNTWLATATETAVFFSLGAKRSWSYNATDFPVFGIMVKNLWIDSGTLWYAAGEIPGATNGYTVPFSIYDGEFYGEDEEYIFVPVDLTDMWEGRFNSIRLDFNMADESTREFELCFAGMFRSVDEAYTYANTWLAGNEVETKDPNATEEETEAPTEAPTDEVTEAPETNAPEQGGDATQAPDGEQTTAPAKEGCGSVIGFSAIAILAAAAAAVALKKD
jgi:hypothetical protein